MIDARDVADLLRAATDDIAIGVPPAQQLAAAGNKRRHRRKVAATLVAAAALTVVAAGVSVVLSGHLSDGNVASPDPTTTPPGATCVNPVPSGVLPRWARTGFSAAKPRIPYLLGDHGSIAAILFAQPLTAPPSADHNNKILWVSRVADGSSLRITATLQDGSTTATRVVAGGPGPSIIDLPRPGCWHLTLQWAGRTDSLDLAYVAP